MREILRQAFLPGHDSWPSGERLRWLCVGRAWMLVVTMACNVMLWWTLRDSAASRRGVVDLFLVLNNGLLLLDLVLTVTVLRRPGRFYAPVALIGVICELATTVSWIQMTGTVTSYFIGTIVILSFMYRVAVNYWAGLVATLVGVIGVVTAYVLEEIGVLSRSSLFVGEVGAALLPEVYREAALVSAVTMIVACFIGANLLSRTMQRSRDQLADARARLAAVVDEARMGRLSATRLGRYELGELLGRGGMGEVYEGRGPGGRVVAVKVLHSAMGAEPSARLRFKREGELIARLPASCTAAVLEQGSDAGVEFIAMERLRGEDLGALLRRRGRLDAAEVVLLARGIAAALDVAHARGVVHRDLKPSNVFLLDGEVTGVRLLDFGIARLYEANSGVTVTETAAILGSPGYLPPEQAVGDRDATGPATDVFAMGAILYRAITGQAAFPARSAASAIHEALHLTPVAPSALVEGIPAGVDRALAVAMAKSPGDRYPRAGDLADELERAYGGDPLAHRGPAALDDAPTQSQVSVPRRPRRETAGT